MLDVLIVDDSLADGRLLRLWLEKSGRVERVSQVRTGREALAQVTAAAMAAAPSGGATRLILLDLHLPDMMGWDILEAWKKQGITGLVPIIVLTGTVRPEDPERARQAGAVRCLAKPFDADEFALLNEEIAQAVQEFCTTRD